MLAGWVGGGGEESLPGATTLQLSWCGMVVAAQCGEQAGWLLTVLPYTLSHVGPAANSHGVRTTQCQQKVWRGGDRCREEEEVEESVCCAAQPQLQQRRAAWDTAFPPQAFSSS